jgi:hypothetical protein
MVIKLKYSHVYAISKTWKKWISDAISFNSKLNNIRSPLPMSVLTSSQSWKSRKWPSKNILSPCRCIDMRSKEWAIIAIWRTWRWKSWSTPFLKLTRRFMKWTPKTSTLLAKTRFRWIKLVNGRKRSAFLITILDNAKNLVHN